MYYSIKNRIWERDRRNRFNASFEKLASLLPEKNSSTNLSKVLIIQKATELIEKLTGEQNGMLKLNTNLTVIKYNYLY